MCHVEMGGYVLLLCGPVLFLGLIRPEISMGKLPKNGRLRPISNFRFLVQKNNQRSEIVLEVTLWIISNFGPIEIS
jgi:hypothetical protein